MRGISQGEKTQKATPKRREEERKKGNILQSRDIVSALGLLGLFLFFKLAAPYFYGYLSRFLAQCLGSFADVPTFTVLSAKQYMTDFAVKSLLLAAPFVMVAAGIGMILTFAQTRLNVTFSRLKPDFSKLNPITGIRRLLTMRSLAELLKSVLKVVVVAAVLYTTIKANLPEFMNLSGKSIFESLTWICRTAFTTVVKIGLYMLAFGILDYFYQWWDYERQIRMSYQDIKDEMKQSEGDPQIKGRQRERQRRMAMLRIAQKVPLADVVIKNPTHFAVAIQYEAQKDKAPKVIAKGQDYLALKIIEIAEAHHICVTANPPLARGLYETVALDQEIPEQYYQAVAEILVFVYHRLRK